MALMTLLLVSCGAQQDVMVLRVGHSLDPSHTVHKAMLKMGERLQQLSGGTMAIELYPSGQLGSERELIELLQIGSLAMTKVSASPLEGFVPTMKLFNIPYLFRDQEHFFKVLDSDIGRDILASLKPAQLLGLGYYDAGSRSFYTTKKPVVTPADLASVKIRVQESQAAMAMIRALGGNPTPISWGELYTALQQGVVDGAENNPPSFYLSRHYEVAPYYILDEHTSVPDVILISRYVWERLSEQQQAWLQQAVDESVDFQRAQWQLDTEAALAAVQEAGVQVISADKSQFKQQVSGLINELKAGELGAMIQRIEEVQ
ncbi:MAG: TRAP transporter substrate-binding protein [Aequoribacter sp.]|jgi:tripartite ATP-independent transporter DctP family solute receptor|uniref:TRAP transporter substrate-binding protein n=1 Tax=Aequoribacter sp. TaxID=2847771 RepID=UPI003C3C9759